MAPYQFHPTVLREYDIRGIVGKTLSRADAVAVGQGFGTAVRRAGGLTQTVAVGWDGRLSSPDLASGVVEGLVSTGLKVIRIGRGPTPKLYYAVRHLKIDGGVMITGSHNPPDYNGFKMMLGKASFWGPAIQELGQRAASGDVERGSGSAVDQDIHAAYVARLAEGIPWGKRNLTVVWDVGNGASGEVMVDLARSLPGRHILLNETIDGTFPAHHPDPTVPENLVQLQASVAQHKADLGIAFDGDADRIGAVDQHGRIVWGDQLVWLYAHDVLRERPGATILADVKASQALFDEIARMGGKPVMWKTGHSILKSKMAELSAPLAGEMSGHIFFADHWYGFDDALYCGVRLLSFLSRSEASLAEMRDRFPKVVNTPELRFQCSEDRKFKVVEEVRDRLRASGAKFNDVDGVRVLTQDGWWLLRASNTQDVLVARCEAKDDAGLTRLKADVAAQLRASGLTPPAM
jgi:phosphomannomutase